MISTLWQTITRVLLHITQNEAVDQGKILMTDLEELCRACSSGLYEICVMDVKGGGF